MVPFTPQPEQAQPKSSVVRRVQKYLPAPPSRTARAPASSAPGTVCCDWQGMRRQWRAYMSSITTASTKATATKSSSWLWREQGCVQWLLQ
jgi:hypothetical protein